jgi:hypothetical protein
MVSHASQNLRKQTKNLCRFHYAGVFCLLMSAWFFKIIIAREKYFFNSEVLLDFKIFEVRKTPIFRKNTCFKESIQKTPQTLGALGDFRDG